MANNFLFTSESVTEGHPDKIADAISDSVLDAIFTQDPNARVACETLITTGFAVVAGEITTTAQIDYQATVRNAIKEIGYDASEKGFDYQTCGVLVSLDRQSPDISQGVSGTGLHKEEGAGDQGMMFGYACNQTPEFMPMPIALAHRLTRCLSEVRKNGTLNYLRPDGKSQVTVSYANKKPVAITSVVISSQHDENVTHEQIVKDIRKHVIDQVLPKEFLNAETKYYINPTGRFVVGGPQGDCGLTGRKIIVDTYGGWARHGGGAFSGKDCTKVDRSAAYAARWVAKNIVAAELADECEIQLAYAIGVAKPLSVHVNTFGTGKVSDEELVRLIDQNFDLTPRGIISSLKLRQPIYRQTAAYGHFGRTDIKLPWEALDKVEALKKSAKVAVSA